MAARLGGIHETNPSALLLPHLLFFLCLPEGAPGTLQPLFLPPARGEIAACVCPGITVPTHGRRCRVWSGWGVAGGSGLDWSGAGWLQREGPRAVSCSLSSRCKRHFRSSKRKRRTSGLKFWPGLVGSHGWEQIWPESQLRHVHMGENTACTVCALEAHSAPGSERSSARIQNREEGKASSDSRIALLNSNQMCGVCNLFCSPFASHKLSRALTHRKSRAGGTSPP